MPSSRALASLEPASAPPTTPVVFFDTLPGEEREVFDLLWYQELPQAEAAARDGAALIVLTDQQGSAERLAAPMILATAGVHGRLTKVGLRTYCSIVVRTADGAYAQLPGNPATTFPDHSGRPRNILDIRDRIKELELPLFAGYLFCRFPKEDRIRVEETPGVLQAVKFNGQLAAVEDYEIGSIRAMLASKAGDSYACFQVLEWSSSRCMGFSCQPPATN